MRLSQRILSLTIAFALSFPFAASAAPQAQDGAPLAEPSKSLYWQGHESLGRSDWREALGLFRELEAQLAASKTEPTDAAIYWQAYALAQAKRPREAGAEIERLRRSYPQSVWLDDADALVATILPSIDPKGDRGDKGDKGPKSEKGGKDTHKERDADALMALDALLAGGSPKAVPLLQRVLAGDHGDRVKTRALFVLSQIDASAADSALDDLLNGSASPRMKTEAIRMIAAGGRRESLDRLLPLYRSSTDAAVKRGVLDAFLIGGRGDLMLKAIENETDGKRRRDAIEKLGAMGEHAALKQLYNTSSDPQDRRALLRGFGIAGDRDGLIEIARRETDVELRAEAIVALGIVGGKETADALVSFYQPGQPEVVANAVIQALMMTGASEQMVMLYRKETDAKRRRELLQMITATDPDAALELIDQALQK